MIFVETGLPGAFLVELEPRSDERGFFARAWCAREAADHGLETDFVQCNISYNARRGTLRGMHFQYPAWEAKLVRVTRGAAFDAIVDLRRTSPTYRRCFSTVLDDENHRMVYVPEGFAHGFMTLRDETEVFYQMSAYHAPGQACGFRWDDPQFAIPWPGGDKILSPRDRDLPVFTP